MATTLRMVLGAQMKTDAYTGCRGVGRIACNGRPAEFLGQASRSPLAGIGADKSALMDEIALTNWVCAPLCIPVRSSSSPLDLSTSVLPPSTSVLPVSSSPMQQQRCTRDCFQTVPAALSHKRQNRYAATALPSLMPSPEP